MFILKTAMNPGEHEGQTKARPGCGKKWVLRSARKGQAKTLLTKNERGGMR